MRMQAKLRNIFGLFFVLIATGCYSFKTVTVDPNVRTVSVADFENRASLIEPTLSQTLTEKMKNKMTSEARLDLLKRDGHASFKGVIERYQVTYAASGANDQAALNRLTIAIKVEYNNTITNENWSQSFSHFENFDSNANLNDVAEQLIELITNNLVDDVFNRAFSNW